MSQSLYTAMGGISSATTQLSVISNNVANINTTGYKSSSVQFSDVYYSTLAYGSVSTADSGGTNPIQVGVGVQVASVSTNFKTGSWYSTGSDTDLMINGSGFFSVQAPDGSPYYTRAGNFSIDANGNLVTANGYKVLGTASTLSGHSSGVTVQIPTSITAVVSGSDILTNAATTEVSSLNGTKSAITNGYFQVTVSNGATSNTYNVIVNAGGSVADMVNQINTSLNASDVRAHAHTDGTITFEAASPTETITFTTPTSSANISGTTYSSSNFLTQTGLSSAGLGNETNAVTNAMRSALTAGAFTITDSVTGATTTINLAVGTSYADNGALVNAINGQLTGTTISASLVDGQIKFSSTTTGDSLTIADTTGNFVATCGMHRERSSNTLDYSVHISDLTNQSTSANSETINSDGSLEVTYKDGSTLSVEQNADGTYSFVYTSPDSIKIDSTKCVVDTAVAVPANFVIQMATVTNTEGLLQVGSNMYTAGPNTGDIIYTVAGKMGCGEVQSGGLEASNVDLSQELSNMILAQRAIQANSRVFTTTSDIMQTITQMGR